MKKLNFSVHFFLYSLLAYIFYIVYFVLIKKTDYFFGLYYFTPAYIFVFIRICITDCFHASLRNGRYREWKRRTQRQDR